MRRNLCIGVILVAATLGVYGQTLTFDFVDWDDSFYVANNEHVAKGLTRESAAWALLSTERINWHPLTWLSHMADVELYGLHPGGHHATNVLLHVLNSLLLFALFSSMTHAPWRSALVALLFAIHPLHVESVAWISERKDVLSVCMGLLSTWAYVSYARRGRAWRYLLSAAFLALALMSKAMLVTLPFVFFLLDYWPLQRRATRLLFLEKIPLLVLSAGTSAITFVAQRSIGGAETEQPLRILERIANAVVSYATYLVETLWPSRLSMFYPHPYIPEAGGVPLAAWQIAASAAALLAISALVVRFRDRRWAGVGWCWFLGTLVPVIGLVQVSHQAMADRYMYLPSVGLFLMIAWGGSELFELFRSRWDRGDVVLCGAAISLIALGVTAWSQTAHWRDSISLFRNAVEAVPRNPSIRYNLANQLRDAGEIDEAIREYRRALEATPDSAPLNVNLANVLRSRGMTEEAIALYERALRAKPDDVRAHINLGSAYRNQGRFEEAMLQYQLALRAGPDRTALYNMANLLRAQGKIDEAIERYREALQIAPNDPRIHNNLAIALAERGAPEEAAHHYFAALRIAPNHYRAYNNLGRLFEAQGNLDDAIRAYRYSLRIEPDQPAVHSNLAGALRAQGNLDEALRQYRKALEIDPDDAAAGQALHELGGAEAAPRDSAAD